MPHINIKSAARECVASMEEDGTLENVLTNLWEVVGGDTVGDHIPEDAGDMDDDQQVEFAKEVTRLLLKDHM